MKPVIDVIIPAFNEEQSIAKVVAGIPADLVREIIVINNASTDRTAEMAATAGATVLSETVVGYGQACLMGIAYCRTKLAPPEIVVFMDGDYSDYAEEMPDLVRPIAEGHVDMVIGSRALGERENGAMTIPQIFGNWLATTVLRLVFKANFTDLGPFRAIRFSSLLSLEMRDTNYGWTVEMQVKAARKNLRWTEVPARYRKRIGISKVSGTVKGTIMAGYKILYTLFKYS